MVIKLEKKWKILILIAFLASLIFVNIESINVYASSVIIFAFSLFLYNHNRRDLLTVAALYFVFVVDCLIGYQNYAIVIAVYLIFHLLCAARLYLNLNKKFKIIELISRFSLIIIVEIVTAIIFKSDFSLLYFFAIFYFANLVMNVVTAGLQIKTNAVFFIGILIFMLSDIFVGLDQLGIFYKQNIIEITYILAVLSVMLSLVLKPTKNESATVFNLPPTG